MRKSRYKIMPSPMDLTIGAVAAVGLLSFLLLIYSDLLWRNNFRRSVPLLDNLMHARVSAAEGHIWLEEVLRGNEVVRIGVVRGFYGQAAEAMDACLEGKSAINGVPGLPLEDLELAGQLDRLKWSFKQSERIAEQRWQSQGKDAVHFLLSQEHQAAYHGGGLLASAINLHLQQNISEKMKEQRKIFHLTLALWGGVLACLCGILFLAGKRQKKAERALLDSESRLRLLSSHLMTAQERERRRISLELHDELGQSLTALKLKIRAAEKKLQHEKETVKNDCSNILNYIDQIIENARRLSRDLSPSTLEDLGLTAAIRWLSDDFARHSGIEISHDLPDIDELFDREAAIIIYRIFQEALNNIAKHSKAQHVSIVIERSADEVFFAVHDDGRGFDLKEIESGETAERGLGIAAMHERTRMLGGVLEISSSRDRGTRITFTAPLARGGTGELI
jgi:signal transduction histidine kinase